MPFVVVVPLLVAPKVIVVPSTAIDSFAPSAKPLTVNVKLVIVWPLSIGLTFALLKTLTALLVCLILQLLGRLD